MYYYRCQISSSKKLSSAALIKKLFTQSSTVTLILLPMETYSGSYVTSAKSDLEAPKVSDNQISRDLPRYLK